MTKRKPKPRPKTNQAPGSLFQPGMHVEATRTIVQGDVPYNPEAAPGDPGWRHAKIGDRGFVMTVDRLGLPTVHFPDAGTDTLCFAHELRIIGP